LLVALVVTAPSGADDPASTVATAAPAAADRAGPEIAGLRTEFSRTFAGLGGSRRTRLSTVPVNFRNAQGDWQPIDTDLRADAGGYETTAAAATVQLPDGLDQPAKVSAGGRWLSFALRGADGSVAPAVRGATATYNDVLTGVDAAYDAQAAGVKETLTLADASAPSSYGFDLDASSGLTPSLADDGSVVVGDSDGHTRFVLPAPTVQAADQQRPTAAHVSYQLSDGGQRLTVAVDADWLSSATFPVQIDPSVYRPASVGCTVASGSPSTASCNGTSLKVGHVGGGSPTTERAILRFADLGTIDRSASIIDAALFLPVTAQTGSGSTVLDAYPLQTNIPTSSATWNTYDGTHNWGSAGGDYSSSLADTNTVTASTVGSWTIFDLSPLAQGWVRQSSPNVGVLVREHDESIANEVTLKGPASGAADGAHAPTLEIDWVAHPGFERDGTYESQQIDDRSDLSVNVATGNLALQSTDINLPGVAGNDLTLSRTYNSADLAYHSIDTAQLQLNMAGWSWEVNGAGLREQYIHPHLLCQRRRDLPL
jgi:hypothetical protein